MIREVMALYEATYQGDFEILAFLLSFFLFFAVAFVLFYVLFAVGLMKMAQRENVENPWLAWIPFAQSYTMGRLVSHKLGENSGWIVLGLTILSSISSFIPFIGFLISLGVAVFMFIVMHWIYEKYSDKSVIMTVLTVLTIGALAPIFIFAIRNNERKVEQFA